MEFKNWISLQEGYDTYCKLGLYPPIADALGQYPPLYATAKSPDFITYFHIEFDKNFSGDVEPSELPQKNGFINYHKHPKRKFNFVHTKSVPNGDHKSPSGEVWNYWPKHGPMPPEPKASVRPG